MVCAGSAFVDVAELYISSDAPDTDFVVRVTDVDEKGRSIKLADGVLSVRYRNRFEKAEFLEEGEIACLKIRTTKQSNCFRKGHRIRVTVTSGAENFIFPNSNTREGYNSAATVVAENTLYHGGAHASKLIVRVEDRGRSLSQRRLEEMREYLCEGWEQSQPFAYPKLRAWPPQKREAPCGT